MPKKAAEPEPIQTYHGMAEERMFPGLLTKSLVESIREDLPEAMTPENLVFLVHRQPGLYATFLGKLIAGSSFRTAALACGLNYTSLMNWLRQGGFDLVQELDTYCGRLLLDCQRAASLAITDAEERVFRSDPIKWLGRGPGKLFFKGELWSDAPANQIGYEGAPQIENPLDPEIEAPVAVEETQSDDGSKDLSLALKVLEDHQIVNSPEFFKQARQQYKLLAPEEPKDD